ncbi:MAG: hypothetical protein ABSF23_18765 [Terracidiphilus sp.]|jgi:hypothetical protein
MAASTPYETLVNAGSSLIGAEILDDCDGADITAVRSFIANNHDSLELAREALRAKCSVPLKYELSFFSEHLDDGMPLRNLARAFTLELRFAESQGNFTHAANIGMDMFELANAIRRGGLITDFLFSLAISGLAIDQFRRIRLHLDYVCRRDLINALDRIERDQEPFSDIAKRDRQWEKAVEIPDKPSDFTKQEIIDPAECGISEDGQRAMCQWVQSFAALPKNEQNAFHADQDRHNIALLRMLAIDLALRSYYHAKSAYPGGLGSLIPDTLSCLPLDPFTVRPFLYRRLSADSFTLYSTGPSKIDHGGVFGPWMMVAAGNADLCLDAGENTD